MTSIKNIEVPWLLTPVWKDFPMTKGLGHHRVPVGILLAADEDLKVTLTSEKLSSIQVRLLNNDSKTEGNLTIKSSSPGRSATIKKGAVTVPFVDSEYVSKIPSGSRTVSITYPSSSKVLPIFHFDDDEAAFFELWDSEKAEFAYVESDYFGLLIPERDKAFARALPSGKRLNDLIAFYDEIYAIYNDLIGLSFEETGTNSNVRNKFFMKADKSGAGFSYYNSWCTAASSLSVISIWLNMSLNNWAALRTIGNGYEVKLRDATFSTDRVWNMILAVLYQYIILGDEIYTKGALARSGTKIDGVLMSGKPVEAWGSDQKLSFLIHMFFKAGQQSFIRFNQLARQDWDRLPYYIGRIAILEKLMFILSVDFGLDVYPFIKLAKAVILEEKLLEYYYLFSEVAYPLNYLISDQKQLKSTKEKFNLFCDTTLVTPLELRVTNLKGDVTIEIDKNIFSYLSSGVFKLMDGPRTILERKFSNQKITLKDLPIGVYKIFIPSNTRNSMLIYDDVYAVVHANTPRTLTLSAKTMEISPLLFDRIEFLGLADRNFASLSVDSFKQVIKFNTLMKTPHSYFEGKTYASIKIRNRKNEVILSVNLEGTDSTIKLYEIPFRETLEIEIFHSETKERLITGDPTMHFIIDRKTNTNVLSVSKLGFQNKQVPQTYFENGLLKRIDDAANKIRKQPFLIERPYCHPKYDLFLAVKAFKKLFKDHALSSKLDSKYRDCLPPGLSTGLLSDLENLNLDSVPNAYPEDGLFETTLNNIDSTLLPPNIQPSSLELLELSDEIVSCEFT